MKTIAVSTEYGEEEGNDYDLICNVCYSLQMPTILVECFFLYTVSVYVLV